MEEILEIVFYLYSPNLHYYSITKIISETGASGIASMGKVMGLASAQIGGSAEGKTISTIVKKLLT